MPKPSRFALITGFVVLVAAAILTVAIGPDDPSSPQASIPTDTVPAPSGETSIPPATDGTGSAATSSMAGLTTAHRASGDDIVGYIGCSNTSDTVNGYFQLGGMDFWPPEAGYGGGTAVSWATSLSYWEIFDTLLATQPTTTFWWQICLRKDETDNEVQDASLGILTTLASKVPDATVYLSGLEGWVDPHICGQVGPAGEERIDAEVSRLVSEGRVLPGPAMPDLFGGDSQGTGVLETRADGCHASKLGKRRLGSVLLGFFG